MSERTTTLNRVLLSFPTLISLATTTADDDTSAQSWIQLAVVGEFVSSKYGTFSITQDDLSQMVQNFAANRTVIDYDHLTSDPQRPGDGIAAGWLQRVELRDDGTTLWGLCDWTPDAEKRIENREYRFISPSFLKDYTDPTGEQVGTKLLAAALTNLPFLPDMAAVTLATDAMFGQFALNVPVEIKPLTSTVHHLAERGQRVTFQPDAERTPELSEEERRQTFVVQIAIDTGDDGFVRLMSLDGTEFGWFRATQLAPARGQVQSSAQPENTIQEVVMSQQTDVEKLAAEFALRVNQKFASVKDWTQAFALAQREDEAGADAYRLAGVGAMVAAAPTQTLSLSERPGETFDDLVRRYAIEKAVPLRVAAHEVGKVRPDLAAARV